MFDHADRINWPTLVRAYGQAERSLGQLAFALETTASHPSWLWREISRVAVTIAQASGHQAKVGSLRLALIGAPVDQDENTPGLAVAKRIFLTASPLFRAGHITDSTLDLWPQFWHNEAPRPRGEAPHPDDDHDANGAGEEGGQRDQLITLTRELAGLADDGRRPALINLLIDLRRHAGTRCLPPPMVRLALPLALHRAELLPKAAPGLLGGRRLALGMSVASPEAKPLSDWLKSGLEALATEARQSHQRLLELTRQHRAWHKALAVAGLRRHAKTPQALDLLAATPVLSIGLIARHVGCSHVAAGKIIERLVGHGILLEQTARSRHKIFVAGDLATPAEDEASRPLLSSEPAMPVDVDGIAATLDGLLADLDQAMVKTRSRLAEGPADLC